MLSFVRNFTPEEKGFFWRPFGHPTRVCRMTFSLRRKNAEIFNISCNSVVTNDVHAEIVAYDLIQEELAKLIQEHSSSSSLLDFIIASNNSPCCECRKLIMEWIISLQTTTPVRLILLFSHLYESEEETGNIIILFTKWILKLVENNTVVIICPIIVHRMVPEVNYDFNTLIKTIESDYSCFEKILIILEELKANRTQEGFFDISQSYHLLKYGPSIPLRLFTWDNPQYISIYPKIIFSSVQLFPPQQSHAFHSRSVSYRLNPKVVS